MNKKNPSAKSTTPSIPTTVAMFYKYFFLTKAAIDDNNIDI